MGQIHVITQSKKDYYNEQYHKLRFFGWMIVSVLFASLFYTFIKSLSTLFYVWVGFIFLFAVSDITKNPKTRSYIQVFLGVLYGIWGILFLLATIIYMKTTDERIFGFIITVIFLFIAYKKINKFTNLFSSNTFRRPSHRSRRRQNNHRHRKHRRRR